VRLSFSLLLGAGSDLQRQITEVVQQSYRKAGIEMAIRPLEWAAFAGKVDAGDFEASILALSLDPNPDLYPFWHSSQKAPAGWNTVGYQNPAADAVMDEIRTTFDREKARTLFREILTGRESRGYVSPLLTRDGSERRVSWSGKVLRAASGETRGVVGVGVDITERLRLEEEQERIRRDARRRRLLPRLPHQAVTYFSSNAWKWRGFVS